jgi:hypothetical protein
MQLVSAERTPVWCKMRCKEKNKKIIGHRILGKHRSAAFAFAVGAAGCAVLSLQTAAACALEQHARLARRLASVKPVYSEKQAHK